MNSTALDEELTIEELDTVLQTVKQRARKGKYAGGIWTLILVLLSAVVAFFAWELSNTNQKLTDLSGTLKEKESALEALEGSLVDLRSELNGERNALLELRQRLLPMEKQLNEQISRSQAFEDGTAMNIVELSGLISGLYFTQAEAHGRTLSDFEKEFVALTIASLEKPGEHNPLVLLKLTDLSGTLKEKESALEALEGSLVDLRSELNGERNALLELRQRLLPMEKQLNEQISRSQAFEDGTAMNIVELSGLISGLYFTQAEAHGRTLSDFEKEFVALTIASLEKPGEHNPLVLLKEGQVALQLGDYATAEERLDRAIELVPTWPAMYIVRGLTFRRAEEYEKAIRDFDKAIELAPFYGGAFFGRGLSELYLGRLSKAERDFEKALSLFGDPKKKASAWENIGLIRIHQQKWNEAFEISDNVIRWNEQSAWIWLVRSIAAFKLENKSTARKAHTKWRNLRTDSDTKRLMKLLPVDFRLYVEQSPA